MPPWYNTQLISRSLGEVTITYHAYIHFIIPFENDLEKKNGHLKLKDYSMVKKDYLK